MPTSREIAGYFDREYFELHPGKQKYLEYLQRLLASLGCTHGRVLDLGSGYGFLLGHLEHAGYQAMGVELALEAARASQVRGATRVVVGSAEQPLPFAAGSVDAITLLDVIEHLTRFDDALLECRRVLAPGGLLAVITLNAMSVARPLLGRKWSYHLDPTHVEMFSPRRLRNALEGAGLEIVRLTTVFNFCNVGESNPQLHALRRIGRVVRLPWFGDSILAVARCPGSTSPAQ
jgi:SAM-dependent methyltransferase